jgi:hypothetical protein
MKDPKHLGIAAAFPWNGIVVLTAGLLMLLFSQWLAAGSPAVPAAEEDLIAGPTSGPWRRLFLDATVVERQEGLTRRFHAAEKFAGNPVLRNDKPWEGGKAIAGPYLYGTVMWDGGKLRMWYHCAAKGYVNCYAESNDGLSWTKPNLGIIEFEGSKDNNLYLTVTQDPTEKPPSKDRGQCHNASVIKRPWESDPAKRYALFCFGADYGFPRVAFSPDGLHWTFPPKARTKPLFASSDVLNFFFDPYKNRYAATWKTHNRRGRAVGVAWSPDGLNWTKPMDGPVFVADDLDPDATQIYGMPVFPYQGLYIGLPWLYNARWIKDGPYTAARMHEAQKDSPRTVDVQIAWSWDLVNWTRPPDRKPFIARGAKGEFDCDMIFTARAPVVVGDELYFYYGGCVGLHDDPNVKANIGLAKLRLDGFCSMAAGESEGWLMTRREVLRAPQITINAKTARSGYVLAEILDRNDKVIPGFSRQECIAFRGDSTSHVLKWKTGGFSPNQRKQAEKIRLFLQNAELFSYLPK